MQEVRRSMTKRLISLAASVAAIGAATLVLAPSAMATANSGGCQLQGAATFSTPLQAGPAASPFAYTFSGALSSCQSGNASTGPNSTPTGGTIFTPDAGTGSGSCVSSTSNGVAVVNWNDGDATVEQFSTSGAVAAVDVSGTVVSSYTASNGTTYTTNEPSTPVGDSTSGQLTFTPPSPTSCQTGVTSAAINGVVETGSTS
jgi:hypothetical protein